MGLEGIMGKEAQIIINGNLLTSTEVQTVRAAMGALEGVMLDLKLDEDGTALTDSYMIAISAVRGYLELG
jgi:hypothetical protein